LQFHEANRIVVIDWSMIGDLIMLSPCVRAIRAAFPQAHIALLGQAISISAYKHHPGVDELIAYDRSRGDYDITCFRQAVDKLRDRNFDLAFIFHNSFGSALMARLGRVRQRVGYRYEGRDLLLSKRLRLGSVQQHLIETKADMLRMCGITVDDMSEEVYIDHERAKQWTREKLGPNFGRNRPIIAISVGATLDYKQWAPASLHAFLNRFPVNSADLVFLGTPAERALYEGVYSYNNTVVDLVGETTIEELTWVIDRADLFVGPDSGPMHMAVARKRPVLALFGPTNPAKCGPYLYEPSVALRTERICPRCKAHHGKNISQCLHTLDPEEVYCAAVGLLAQYCPRWSLDQV
jgi:lipopolysaccharide heptosyltransferase II